MPHITKLLTKDDLSPCLLKPFNRYQHVSRRMIYEDGRWVYKDVNRIRQWDEEDKNEMLAHFSHCLDTGDFVWASFDEKDKLIAFASLSSSFWGSDKQYLQLMQMAVSKEFRRKGLARDLFNLCAGKAKDLGAKKLYISTNPSEQSQLFYKSVGCVDAVEINKKLAELEPYDRQMEYIL